MKKTLFLLAISLTASMANSNAYDYLTASKNMNIFRNNQAIVGNVNLLKNVLETKERDTLRPIKIEVPSFWMA